MTKKEVLDFIQNFYGFDCDFDDTEIQGSDLYMEEVDGIFYFDFSEQKPYSEDEWLFKLSETYLKHVDGYEISLECSENHIKNWIRVNVFGLKEK